MQRCTVFKVGDEVVAGRHTFDGKPTCECACAFVARAGGGTVTQVLDHDGEIGAREVYVTAVVPNVAGGEPSTVEVAYTMSELLPVEGGYDEAARDVALDRWDEED